MGFFEYYFDLDASKTENQVLCPFPHTVPNTTLVYHEQHPSAHVNLDKRTFHCKACSVGHSEHSFIQALYGCNYASASRLQYLYQQCESSVEWDALALNEDTQRTLSSFGITPETAEELKIKSAANGSIMFPVIQHGCLLDIRTYTPGGSPKVKSRAGAPAGLILPYHEWLSSNKVTLICAGEKDMAVARSHGFNAITITGGENALPIQPELFRDKRVAIVYDNDNTGKVGAQKLGNFLLQYCKSVKVCTGFHEVCKEDKEDITDFFTKYGKSREDLITYLRNTPEYVSTEPASEEYDAPLVDLYTACRPEYVNKLVTSNVQVVAVSDTAFIAPAEMVAIKTDGSSWEPREWKLSPKTMPDVLHMIDNGFKESDLAANYRDILHIMQKEKYIHIKKLQKITVYRCVITDLYETTAKDIIPTELTAYCMGTKLESGKKYKITYKVVPHPYKGQALIALIWQTSKANDSVTDFVVTPQIKENLREFLSDAPLAERIDTCVEKVKGLLNYNGNNTLIKAIDFAYHTALEFNFGRFTHLRGYLDTIIVGESRMGKSSTAECLRKTYGLGAFTSLAGNAATTAGLIGGSNKVANGSYQTRAGLIPQNHKGLLIFEELGKTTSNIIKELTDIRSSNEVRIARVSGTITLPATVRMITLTNVKNTDGVIKPIASYPNGISILTELIGTAEDIARYDIALILGDRGPEDIDPMWQPAEPYSEEAYRARIRWIWSRTAEQIQIAPELGYYIVQQANALNAEYGCHIKIFGTEAWKKIARLAIAIAGYVVSSDEDFENIIVLKEHVDYAVQFLKEIYDNPVFKLKEYAMNERKYSTIDDAGVALLQDIYIKAPALLLQLEQVASTTKNTLQAATGLTNDEYNAQMNKLAMGLFITFSKYEICPTERFRIGMSRINRNVRATRVGEQV